MYFKRVVTEGLAHYSYILADGNEGIVIDPRSDVEIYLELAEKNSFNIKYIFETHRNEDYVVGSTNLANLTGAEIYHADRELNYNYGKELSEGKRYTFGKFELEAINTPGHTPDSFSFLLYTTEGEPWMIFTGDLLFAGDVGRVDFLGEDMIAEMTGRLYDSIYSKILPLGDEVILWPAHGTGSACGSHIADRQWTTIGLEKKLNHQLNYDKRDNFINDVGEMRDKPNYFKKMEKMNLEDNSNRKINKIEALNASQFEKGSKKEDTIILDTRKETAFASAHIEDSYFIWEDRLANFAGWFLPLDKNIFLISDNNYPKKEIEILFRLGFDKISGYLKGDLLNWHTSGRNSESINIVNVKNTCKILDSKNDSYLLDVRKKKELKNSGEIIGAHNIPLQKLNDNISKLPEDKEIYIFCGSGVRAMIAASLIKRKGYDNLNVVLGGLKGWQSKSCPLEN